MTCVALRKNLLKKTICMASETAQQPTRCIHNTDNGHRKTHARLDADYGKAA
jgi:hypothetical protein